MHQQAAGQVYQIAQPSAAASRYGHNRVWRYNRSARRSRADFRPAVFEDLMGARKTKSKPKRSKAKTASKLATVSPTLLMATRSLINMVVVGVTSGAVLLTLLAARHL